VSGYVALRLPLPGAVVTYFVTGSRTSSLRNTQLLVLPPKARQDHSGMTGESGAGTGIGGRAPPLPVTVRQIRRNAFVVIVRRGVQADASGACLNHGSSRCRRYRRAVAGGRRVLDEVIASTLQACGCLLLWRLG
jgi:hypothetical protein